MARTARKLMYSVSINPEYKSKEVRFYCKPSDDVRTFLKENRFRWNGANKCWYGFICMDVLTTALNGYGMTEVNELPEKKMTAKRLQREENRRREREELAKEEYAYRKENGLLTAVELKAEADRKAEAEADDFDFDDYFSINDELNGWHKADDGFTYYYRNGVIDEDMPIEI